VTGSAATIFSEWQDAAGRPRDHYAPLADAVATLGRRELCRRWDTARRRGQLDAVTFYLDPHRFRAAPADWLPRVIPHPHWEVIAAGVGQRLKAINRFLLDLYHGSQDIVPDEVVYTAQHFYPEVLGFHPPRDLFVHLYAIDLVHLGAGRYVVLEDTARIPFGIGYQLKTLELVGQVIPEFAAGYDLERYEIRQAYLDLFRSLCGFPSPVCVLLTDGRFGAAFFEHRYLSELLGIPLVEGSDLYVGYDGRVYLRTLDRDLPVDLIYRRVEDLDLFVPGLHDACLEHRVTLVNAIGAGAVEDKLVFKWVPEMIERYLGEAPILPQATSYDLTDPASRRYVLDHLDRLVIKSRREHVAGGVSVVPDLGPAARGRAGERILEQPRMLLAQECLDFSQHMVLNAATGALEGRYVDLRVFALQDGSGRVTVFPGGLTRVAPATGRITSHLAGGSFKPTWVLRQESARSLRDMENDENRCTGIVPRPAFAPDF